MADFVMNDIDKENYPPSVNFIYLISQVEKLVTELETNLKPLLVSLSPELRNELVRTLDNSIPFIGKVINYTKTHARFIPDDMNLGDLNMDFSVITTIKNLNEQIIHLSRLLNDTIILCGSEALKETTRYFDNIRRLAEANVPGAQIIYDDLKLLMKKSSPLIPADIIKSDDNK